ncbi:unnamed protein product [Rotaria sp. Silwood1]|nr:unnamed protein product [Rotaria sp. Silwood1]CAF1612084.1 unnamed protein product [Rotaria sp. Silwood1]CAF3713740.1 unnamed protein product [Rotaria sp. Silwood1]CAF3730605.1 unnamed protein product [Rotaria sp. Silwood1]CAF4518450.1 unnamed protein product [Rotaria sp. Silwood1]
MSTIFEDENDDNEEWMSIDGDNDVTWNLYGDNNDETEDNRLTHHHREPEELKDLDWNDIPNYMRQLKYNHLKVHERHKTRGENRTILSIRRKSIAGNIIIRLPYKGTSFYLGSKKDFHQKSIDYMKRTGVYKCIQKLDRTNDNVSETCLAEMVNGVETMLDNLLDSNCISEAQYLLMNIVPTSVRMHYLYFVPETGMENSPLQPIFVCNEGPTMNIVRYVTPLLWSIFDRATNCTRFSNGAIDVIHAMEHYAQMGQLQSQIVFVTFNINELTTIFPHEKTMATLAYFLRKHLSDQKLNDLTIDTILKLVDFVLKTQFCVYNYTLYQQIQGGASGLPLTRFLAYLHFFFGQHSELVKIFTKNNEFFGRYREQAILTWHGSKYEFLILLNNAPVGEEQISNAVTISIGSTAYFQDVEMSSTHQSSLDSKVYYDPYIDTLPNVTDEIMENTSNQLYAVLYRAVRCCSDVEKFHSELLFIQVSFLLFGSTTEFIHSGIEHFYREFGLPETFSATILDDNQYNYLRRRIIEDVEQQIELKQQREKEIDHTIFMACPHFIDQDSTDAFKQCFEYWWNNYYASGSQKKIYQIKWIRPTSIAVPDGHKLFQWFDNDEKLKSTRKLAHTVNSMYYLQLQQQLWPDYFDLDWRASMASRCSKTMTQLKFDLMAMPIGIAQDTARGDNQLAVDTKDKL